MYGAAEWAEVHRLFWEAGMKKAAIARRLGMSRNTVDRLLGLSEPPSYVRQKPRGHRSPVGTPSPPGDPPDAGRHGSKTSRSAARAPRKGNARRKMTVLPPKLLPMSPEEQKVAVRAFALLLDAWLEQKAGSET